jgi:hypothetical protein
LITWERREFIKARCDGEFIESRIHVHDLSVEALHALAILEDLRTSEIVHLTPSTSK